MRPIDVVYYACVTVGGLLAASWFLASLIDKIFWAPKRRREALAREQEWQREKAEREELRRRESLARSSEWCRDMDNHEPGPSRPPGEPMLWINVCHVCGEVVQRRANGYGRSLQATRM